MKSTDSVLISRKIHKIGMENILKYCRFVKLTFVSNLLSAISQVRFVLKTYDKIYLKVPSPMGVATIDVVLLVKGCAIRQQIQSSVCQILTK